MLLWTCRCETVNTVIFKNIKTGNCLLLQVINSVCFSILKKKIVLDSSSVHLATCKKKVGRMCLHQGCTNLRRPRAWGGGMKFCLCFLMLAGPKHGTCNLVAPRILKWLLEFWKICVPLARMMLCLCITLCCNAKCVCNDGLW